jgi:hypothetical protein
MDDANGLRHLIHATQRPVKLKKFCVRDHSGSDHETKDAVRTISDRTHFIHGFKRVIQRRMHAAISAVRGRDFDVKVIHGCHIGRISLVNAVTDESGRTTR